MNEVGLGIVGLALALLDFVGASRPIETWFRSYRLNITRWYVKGPFGMGDGGQLAPALAGTIGGFLLGCVLSSVLPVGANPGEVEFGALEQVIMITTISTLGGWTVGLISSWASTIALFLLVAPGLISLNPVGLRIFFQIVTWPICLMLAAYPVCVALVCYAYLGLLIVISFLFSALMGLPIPKPLGLLGLTIALTGVVLAQ